ncbi:hypothetical protein [Nitrosomonas marina]|uniref:Outer membrane protein beta-barrel domain-containing protein n=1 Tax=Nitrosomonas marina TaxID=917 RepID=A0A1H8CMS4_9PROT|nr:hypothetical protein [Nitrosomonas marina]SEM96340.1 hypothetical protein SAMN05216325_10547 [Nitrosomonas marina]
MNYFHDRKKLDRGLIGIFILTSMLAFAPQVLANDRTHALEQKVQELENMLRAVQSELQKVRSESTSQAVEARKAAVEAKAQATVAREEAAKAAVQKEERPSKHMVFFRGGFTHAREPRDGSSIRSDVAPLGIQDQADTEGWYTGAGFDFNLTDDVWGLLPKTSVYAELMFEYKNFSNSVQGNALANHPTLLVSDVVNPRSVTVSQFTLTASPKIKFFEGSKIRPWIIPMGLALHVVSPTTESITYLTPGVQFGAGVDYNVWKNLYVGIDGRYHLTAGKSDGVKVDGMTAGGYIGIGF